MKCELEKNNLLMENTLDGCACYQVVYDRSNVPVDYILINVNPAFEAITGLTGSDILGKTVTEVLSGIKESGFNWIDAYGQVANTGKPIRFESCLEPLNRWCEVSIFSVAKGFIASVFRDITEKKRATETLVASETRYRRLFESAKDGILILDAENGMIIDVNPFLLELLGYTEEEFLNKAIWEIGTFTDVIASIDNFIELQQKEYVRYEDLPLQTMDGREIAVEFVSNVYLEGQGKVIQQYS